jgi:hypothetical protein
MYYLEDGRVFKVFKVDSSVQFGGPTIFVRECRPTNPRVFLTTSHALFRRDPVRESGLVVGPPLQVTHEEWLENVERLHRHGWEGGIVDTEYDVEVTDDVLGPPLRLVEVKKGERLDPSIRSPYGRQPFPLLGPYAFYDVPALPQIEQDVVRFRIEVPPLPPGIASAVATLRATSNMKSQRELVQWLKGRGP